MVFSDSKLGALVHRLIIPFKDMQYLPKWVVLFIDTCLTMIAFTISYLVCYDLLSVPIIFDAFIYKLLLNTAVAVIFFMIFRTYSGIIRYSTFTDALKVFYAVLFSNLIMIIISSLLWKIYSRTIFLNIGFFINSVLTFVFMFSFRMFVRLIYDYFRLSPETSRQRIPILIYGVTSATVSIARMIRSNNSIQYRLAGFITTTSNAAHKTLLGVPVYHKKEQYSKILKRGDVQTILLNPSELSKEEKQEIIDFCLNSNIQMIAHPPISEWDDGKPKIGEIKTIQIEDLLGRDPIFINDKLIGEQLANKCILITGAAGSIGSEIARQISQYKPKHLILCDCAESPLYALQLEMAEKMPNLKFSALISDVRNKNRMEKIFSSFRPQYVFHAAAYKHVPLMELYPSEAIITNIEGTKNVADLSVKYGAEAFVMVSTDKAVNPSNIMGASKRIAEIYIQSYFSYLHDDPGKNENITKFITTRFGNVLGSNGSVIPRFKEQIAKGGPVTVTHPQIIRYFMTIPEACRLVLEASIMGKGGEIFIFDMGEPVKIVDLAERMIRLAGFTPGQEIKIEFSGLRPGEKLYEELLNQKEYTQPTHHKKIMIATVRKYDYNTVLQMINTLIGYAKDYNSLESVKMMKAIVPEFISSNSIFEDLDKLDKKENPEKD